MFCQKIIFNAQLFFSPAFKMLCVCEEMCNYTVCTLYGVLGRGKNHNGLLVWYIVMQLDLYRNVWKHNSVFSSSKN